MDPINILIDFDYIILDLSTTSHHLLLLLDLLRSVNNRLIVCDWCHNDAIIYDETHLLITVSLIVCGSDVVHGFALIEYDSVFLD